MYTMNLLSHRSHTAIPSRVRWALFTLILLVLGLLNLGGPAMWWDEGWTLSVARNWAETGRYARLRDGVPTAPGLEASFLVTLPVGLSMRLLGVGIWQGRIFGVLCMVAVLLLLAALAARLYDGKVAVATVAAALLLTPHPQLNPLLQGRQVLAEIPMLAYLLGGYLCLWWALAGPRLAVVPAAMLLGMAWISKAQTAPFLMVSLVAPILAALITRRWATSILCAGALAGAYLVARSLPPFVSTILFDHSLPGDPVSGLLDVVAVVLTPFHRLYALSNLLSFGLPTLLGLTWALPKVWRSLWETEDGESENKRVQGKIHSDQIKTDRVPPAACPRQASAASDLRLALLAFAGSWLGWFVTLSVGVPRYMSPAVLVGCIFLAAMLRNLTDDFDLPRSLERLMALLSRRQPSRAGAAAMLALVLTTAALTLAALGLARYYPDDDHSAQRVAAALNAMPPGTRVETYESELHFLLDQPYHYPPDQVHVELNRRSLLGQATPVAYDPLVSDPDVLVVGTFARGNDLYTPVLTSGAFRQIIRDGAYEVYQRVR